MAKKGKTTEAETTASEEQSAGQASTPELGGYGIAKVKGGYLAYRVTNHGETVVLSPNRHGKPHPEQLHSALGRAHAGFVKEFTRAQR